MIEDIKDFCGFKKKWWKQLRSWLWIGGSALVGASVEGAGQGIVNYISNVNGKICWKSLFTSMALGVVLSVGNLMIHSPRRKGGSR